MAARLYKLKIRNGCVDCGCCSGHLPGWPENYSDGMLIGEWALEANWGVIDRLIASCHLDKIELEPQT